MATGLLGQAIEREYSLADLVRRPNVPYQLLMTASAAGPSVADPLVAEQIDIQLKYSGYIAQQKIEVERQANHEQTRFPVDLDYVNVKGLSFEARQKLSQHRPETLGQASRISGITPAAISILLVHLKKHYWNLNETTISAN